MRRDDVPITFPCGADFASMRALDRSRLCAQCDTVVHDLSAMSEDEASRLLAARTNARLCVRYLYDANGRVVFAGDADVAGARVVPEHRLTARAKARAARAALLLAPLVLFEACGGNAGDYDHGADGDASAAIDSGDASDASDAGTD